MHTNYLFSDPKYTRSVAKSTTFYEKSKKTNQNLQDITSPIWGTNDLTKLTLHLLRKEYVYTKLKYSRSPAFDIVSGGSAALLAAFFGFLISEKFGIELVDSGDFYYLNMYLVIFAYSLKTFKDIICASQSINQFFLLKYLVDYYSLVFGWALQAPKYL